MLIKRKIKQRKSTSDEITCHDEDNDYSFFFQI